MRTMLLPALVAVLLALAVPAKALEACRSFDGGQGCVSLDVPGGVISVTDQKTLDNGVSAEIDITKGSTVLHYVASASVDDAKSRVVGPKKTVFADVTVIPVKGDIVLEIGYSITTLQPASHNCSFVGMSGGCTVCSGEAGTTCKRLHWSIRPVAQKAARL